jgi:hypothetical protein
MVEPTRRDGGRMPRTWWVHPFLVAAFPVVYLFAANIGGQVSVEPLWLPLGIVLAAAAGTLLVAIAIGSVTGVGVARASLGASLLIGLAMTYGHAWTLVGTTVGSHVVLLAVWAVAAVIGLALVVRLPTAHVDRVTTAVSVVAGVLLVLNAVPIGTFALRPGEGPISRADPSASASESGGIAEGRDVWYIVPDRYAGTDALRAVYEFDNEPFVEALRERGFVVAEHSTANYLKTAFSLLSSLNMEELDFDELGAEATAGDDWGPVHRRLQESHAVERFLHDRGYRYVHLGSRRGPTSTNHAADDVYLLGSTTEFDAVLVDTTILAAVEALVPDAGFTGTEDLLVDQTTFQLRTLHRLAADPRRTFVFAHLLVPHPPYVFNADGSRVTDAQRAARSADEQFLEQLRFTNERLIELVDRLQSGEPSTWPIILIAADEGPFPERYAADEWSFPWLEATPEELVTKFSTLAAIHVPGVDRDGLVEAGFTDRITPVNLFRVVFNAAFGTELAALPDRNWSFTVQRELYEQVDVTERVRAAVDGAAAGSR